MGITVDQIRQIIKEFKASQLERTRKKQVLDIELNKELRKLVDDAKKDFSSIVTREVKYAIEHGQILRDLEIKILDLPTYAAAREIEIGAKEGAANNPILQELVDFIKSEGLKALVYVSDGSRRAFDKEPFGYITAIVSKNLLQEAKTN